jgi:signal transduction histidine kinase
MELRFFLLFFFGLFGTYALADVITSPALQSIDSALSAPYSFIEALERIGPYILLPFREADTLMKVVILSYMTLCAYGLTHIAMRPAKLLDTRRRYFASNVAHELNTPLSILKATAEITQMKNRDLSQKEMKEFAASVIEDVDRVAEIVKYFLHFSSESAGAPLPMSPVNISSVVNKAGRSLSLLAAEYDVAIDLPNEGEEIVWGNFSALEEMTLRLIKNAIMHSPAGSVVKLSLIDFDHHVHISVFNSGDGISETDLPYIFDPFYKSADRVRHGQRGLGLTIAREVARMHFADIQAQSSPQGGTLFTVKLPK